ncbi:DUF421 domain-containing protein [Bacillus sp. S3]|uniref:DUF421 domain-containing protein n=1 Tax=Bacillus sp. S3 TaxID=486398 RepID=UPI0011879C92|nr:YetF domain-containing protein [Bacillus sp. S3]QCJ44423.1 DUF421 domain-containing protein [Bacillus sp. S3]
MFEWVLRAGVIFIFVVFAVKVMGSRAISQLRLLDFVIALMLGNIIAHPLSDQRIGLKGSVISTIVIVMLYLLGIFLSLKWPGLRRIINAKPYPLIKDGEILYKGLRRARISIDDLLAELRKEKIEDAKKVSLAIWESSGEISLFLDPKYEAVTPSFYQLQAEPFDLPQTIIREGRIDFTVLKIIGKEEEWLTNKLTSTYHTEVHNILLATIDSKHNLKVFLYV